MMTTTSIPEAFSPNQASELLTQFHAAVAVLCQAPIPHNLNVERQAVENLLARVPAAIDALVKKATAAELVVSTAVIGPRMDSQPSFDKLEGIILGVVQKAVEQGKCPVTAVLYRAFYQAELLPDVANPADMEVTRARLLRLAQYLVHAFIPVHLKSYGFDRDAARLDAIPAITQRDDLPSVISALNSLREELSRQYDVGYPTDKERVMQGNIAPIFRWTVSALAELDGFKLQPGNVLSRMVWTFRFGAEKLNKAAVDEAILAA